MRNIFQSNNITMKLAPQTERFILNAAPKWAASMNSPTEFHTVAAQASTGKFIVFGGGSTDTVFTRREVQFAYRAWHDSLHLKYGLDFTIPSELEVGRCQEIIALRHGICDRDAKLLRLDLQAHVQYFQHHGEHPDKQVELLTDCLESSIGDVLKSGKIYH